MPITMMFACAQIGARYRDYCTDYRVLVEGQMRTAEAFGFDYVNTMSDPAREAADCGAVVQYFDHQPVAIVEEQALLADKARLASLKIPDPLGGGRRRSRREPGGITSQQRPSSPGRQRRRHSRCNHPPRSRPRTSG